MSESSESSPKQKTIFLAILFFGGFTLLLIFYLIYKYFRMRRNDIEQRRMIQRHNEQLKRQQKKRQEEALQGSILTPSIKNFNADVTGDNWATCIKCNNGMDSSNISDINEGIIS
jgi:hypothetical protein